MIRTKNLEYISDGDHFSTFNPKTDGYKPMLTLELIFENENEFKYVVITNQINQGKYIKWRKNNRFRVRAIRGYPN